MTLDQHSFRVVVVILTTYYNIGRSTVSICAPHCGIITSQNYILLIEPQCFHITLAVVCVLDSTNADDRSWIGWISRQTFLGIVGVGKFI